MKIIALVIAALFVSSAMATGNGGNNNGPRNGGNSASKSEAKAAAAAAAKSSSGSKSSAVGGNGGQGGAGGTGGGGTAIASVAPMSFAFTVPAAPAAPFVQHDYRGMPQQAPAMGNSYVTASNVCDGASGLGFVFPGGGVNLSGSTLRMMCEGRLNSQAYKALGDDDRAKKVMRVVDEYACSQDATWAKLAREEGICKPEEKQAATAPINPAFNSN